MSDTEQISNPEQATSTETTFTRRVPVDESHIGSLSARSVCMLMLTITVCIAPFFGIKSEEPLYSGFLVALGYYFGQKKQTK